MNDVQKAMFPFLFVANCCVGILLLFALITGDIKSFIELQYVNENWVMFGIFLVGAIWVIPFVMLNMFDVTRFMVKNLVNESDGVGGLK